MQQKGELQLENSGLQETIETLEVVCTPIMAMLLHVAVAGVPLDSAPPNPIPSLSFCRMTPLPLSFSPSSLLYFLPQLLQEEKHELYAAKEELYDRCDSRGW